MTILFLFQKGAPDLTNAILMLLGILFTLLLANSFYEWLRSKPWQNKDNPDPLINNEEVTPDDENTPISSKIDYQSLGLPIGC
jgi:hypothetical protein